MKGYWQAALGGLFLSASFSYFSWETSVLAFLSFTLMLLGFAKRKNFLVGLVGGLFFFVPSLYWIYPTLRVYGKVPVVISGLGVFALSLALSVYFGVFSWLLRFYSGRALYFSPFLWASVEILREKLFTGFPWGSLGYTAVDDLPFLQFASIGGVRFMGFLMVLLAVLLIRKKTKAFAGLFLLLHFIGFILIGPYRAGDYTVAIFQNSWDFRPPITQEKSRQVFDEYMRMARKASRNGVDIMIFPETTVPFVYLSDPGWIKFFKERAKEWNAYLVFPSTESSGTKFYNATFIISPDGRVKTYRKIHLVPFGEYNPLPFIRRIIPRIAMEIGDYTPGREIRLGEFKGHKFATPSCYEAIFPLLVRRMVREGAEFLVNTTNDAWYGKTPAPYQHFMQARVRAVENRRYLLRAASSGISAIIDPYGRILKRTEIYKTEMIVGSFSTSSKISLFTAFAPYIDWLYLTVTLISLIILFTRRLIWKGMKQKESSSSSGKDTKN